MINSKEDYIRFLRADQKALGAYTKHPIFSSNIMILLTDPCWKFQKLMRKLEYWSNCKNYGIYKIYILILKNKYKRMSINLGFSIPINIFDEGLAILHFGSIVISRHASIGKNCTLNSCVNIGGLANRANTIIGDNCYIGPGAKVISNVKIGNNVRIGANAVVNKSFCEDNITIAGVPAIRVK